MFKFKSQTKSAFPEFSNEGVSRRVLTDEDAVILLQRSDELDRREQALNARVAAFEAKVRQIEEDAVEEMEEIRDLDKSIEEKKRRLKVYEMEILRKERIFNSRSKQILSEIEAQKNELLQMRREAEEATFV